MTRPLVIILILLTLASLGQKKSVATIKVKRPQTDTIDYSKFPLKLYGRFVLTKIRQFKGQDIYDAHGGDLEFGYFSSDTAYNNNIKCFLRHGIKDTAMYISWDPNTKEVYNPHAHVVGVVHLNKSNNVLIMNTKRYDSKTNDCIAYRKLYKILKLTFTGIILKDMSNPEFNRTFYFRRQP